jgi:hypothetical protein
VRHGSGHFVRGFLPLGVRGAPVLILCFLLSEQASDPLGQELVWRVLGDLMRGDGNVVMNGDDGPGEPTWRVPAE